MLSQENRISGCRWPIINYGLIKVDKLEGGIIIFEYFDGGHNTVNGWFFPRSKGEYAMKVAPPPQQNKKKGGKSGPPFDPMNKNWFLPQGNTKILIPPQTDAPSQMIALWEQRLTTKGKR